MQTFPVFTFLHGGVSGKVDSLVIPGGDKEDSQGECKFQVGFDDYWAPISEKILPSTNIVLFDGFILPDGLPPGACIVEYAYGRITDKFLNFGIKWILHSEQNATVKKECLSIASADFLLHGERRCDEVRNLVSVHLRRYLLLLPKGHTALGFRTKLRSLERKYVLMESTETGVVFHMLVK